MKPTDQAFPIQTFVSPSNTKYSGNNGLTIRDYLAAKAMQGIISDNRNFDTKEPDWIETLAESSYAIADAMINKYNEK